MANCCCCGGGFCTAGCCCTTLICADTFCGGCLTGGLPLPSCVGNNIGTLPNPACDPTAGQDVPLCNLPLTNPSNDPNLEPVTSPCSHGATDQPPSACAIHSGATAKSGSGSGGGSAAMNAGGKSVPRAAACGNQTSLFNLLKNWGSSIASLAGKPPSLPTGQRIVNTTPSTTGFVLVLILVGGLLLLMAFGKGE